MPTKHRILGTTALTVIFLLISSQASADPTSAVAAFNQALSEDNQDRAMEQLAPGGVQFTLRSMHEGVSPDKLVTPITPHWSMIIPVIFASTSSYTREVEVLNSEAHGDIATVWTRTRTASVRSDGDKATENEFTEVYMLVNTASGWKIAAIADNRQATRLNNASE
jgi:hypothetical protein